VNTIIHAHYRQEKYEQHEQHEQHEGHETQKKRNFAVSLVHNFFHRRDLALCRRACQRSSDRPLTRDSRKWKNWTQSNFIKFYQLASWKKRPNDRKKSGKNAWSAAMSGRKSAICVIRTFLCGRDRASDNEHIIKHAKTLQFRDCKQRHLQASLPKKLR